MAEEYKKVAKTESLSSITDWKAVDDFVYKMQDKVQGKKIYSIEKLSDGITAFIHKEDDLVKIYSDNKDLTLNFSGLHKEALSLSAKDYVVECTIINSSNDSIKVYLTDLIYFDGRDISNLPWNTRRQLMKKFSFTETLKEVPSIIVENKESAQKAISLIVKLKDSKGVIVRDFNGFYCPGETSNDVIIELSKDARQKNQD